MPLPKTPNERIAWTVSQKLPADSDPNQDLLFYLSEGWSIDALAKEYASGNVATIRTRLELQYGKLDIPFPYSSREGLDILKLAFDIFDQNGSR